MQRLGNIARVLAWFLGTASTGATAATIEVLWYTYAHPRSIYIRTMEQLAQVVHTLPESGGARWKLTFFGPDSPRPQFEKYNVLVIQSGEPFSTGQYHQA